MLKKGWFKPRTKPVNTRSELLLAVNEGDAEKAAYLRYTSSQEHLQEAFSASLTNGDETIANILFESVSPLSTHLRIACEEGLATIASLLYADERIPDRKKKPTMLLYHGCESGQLPIVEFFADQIDKRPVKTFLKAFIAACNAGHVHIVSFIVHNYFTPKDYPSSYIGLNTAAKHGHYAVVQYLLECDKFELDIERAREAFRMACDDGHSKIVKLLWHTCKFKPTHGDLCRALPYPKILEFFLSECGVDSMVDIKLFCKACVGCYEQPVILLLNRVDPAGDNNKALCMLSKSGNPDSTLIADILLKDPRVSPNANNHEPLRNALRYCRWHFVELLMSDPRMDISNISEELLVIPLPMPTRLILLSHPTISATAIPHGLLLDALRRDEVEVLKRIIEIKKIDTKTWCNIKGFTMLRIANNYHSHTCAMYLATRCDISLHSLGPYPLRLGKDPEAKTIVIAGLKARCSLMILGNLDETNILSTLPSELIKEIIKTTLHINYIPMLTNNFPKAMRGSESDQEKWRDDDIDRCRWYSPIITQSSSSSFSSSSYDSSDDSDMSSSSKSFASSGGSLGFGSTSDSGNNSSWDKYDEVSSDSFSNFDDSDNPYL